MNIQLSEVVLIDQGGQYHLFDSLLVKARKIRQIQFPEMVCDFNIVTLYATRMKLCFRDFLFSIAICEQ